MRILLIEDERTMSSFLKTVLHENGYVVDTANDGEKGLYLARVNKGEYTAIVSDVMLPKMDGTHICQQIRSEGDVTPFLILTTRDKVEQKVEGLNCGADDYMTKPCVPIELIARIQAITRRKNGGETSLLSARHVTMNTASHEVTVHGEPVTFTPLEFRILRVLFEQKGKTVPRSQILSCAWNFYGETILSNSINVHLKNIRHKIQDDPNDPILITVRGVGYKVSLEEPPQG